MKHLAIAIAIAVLLMACGCAKPKINHLDAPEYEIFESSPIADDMQQTLRRRLAHFYPDGSMDAMGVPSFWVCDSYFAEMDSDSDLSRITLTCRREPVKASK